jgi:hypothetical protein
MGSSDSKGGFTITDRRSFASQEAAKADDSPPPPAPNRDGEGAGAPETGTAAPGVDEHGGRDASTLPAVDFHTFVLSLGSSALLHLGELEHPDGGPADKDLPLAKHTIDILSMLEEKTKGNLTSAEERLMQSLLYDLRLRYVNASK